MFFDFQMTNNQAKYKALITGMKLSKDLGVNSLIVRNISQLFIGQVNGTYDTKVPYLAKYLEKVKGPLENFDHFKFERILQLEIDCINSLG